jgi:hypothetical protein
LFSDGILYFIIGELEKDIVDGCVKSPDAALRFILPFDRLRAGLLSVMVSLSNHARLACGLFTQPSHINTCYEGGAMERALLWFKCAAVHDPVRPVLKRPAAIGWEAKFRQVDLVIERPPLGEELLARMQGWFTVDVKQAANIIQQYGKLKLLDDYHLVVETDGEESLTLLAEKLAATFGEEMGLERLAKKKLI